MIDFIHHHALLFAIAWPVAGTAIGLFVGRAIKFGQRNTPVVLPSRDEVDWDWPERPAA